MSNQESSTFDGSSPSLFFQSAASCVHFTHHSMLNPNPNYPFANNPGVDSCSHDGRIAIELPNSFISCAFSNFQYKCPMYQSDAKTIYKSQTVSSVYFVVKSRLIDGTICYKIVDSNYNIYQDLVYAQISESNADLDKEAYLVFDNFLSQLMSDYLISDFADHDNQDPVKTETKKSSYLLSLI